MQVFLTGNLAHSCVRYVLAISPPCRVKRRLALLASIQPRDNSAEGTPMALGPGSVNRSGAFSIRAIGYLSDASY